MIYCVGLTGNIASGKTTVAQIFAKLGIDVLNADKISKDLTLKNTPAYKEIVAHYGLAILDDHQEINRRQLRDLIFSDPKERIWLEELLHPQIRQLIAHNISLCTSPYCIIEIPLLTNIKDYPYLNKILLITAPIETQISRVMLRDNSTKEQAVAILSNQPNLEQRIANANDIITNDLNIQELTQKVSCFHQKYIKEAQIFYSKKLLINSKYYK